MDINAETYRFWNRQLQNSVIIPTPSPTTAAPTAPPPVSVSQNWCGDVCIDASDLNNAEETVNAYRRAVAVDGQDINNIDVTFSNGGPCVASACSSNRGRKLQAVGEARDIVVTVSGLEPTFNTGEPADTFTVRDKIIQKATDIETAIAADPVLVNLAPVVDVEATVIATNPPTFAPTQSPTLSPTPSPTELQTNVPTPASTKEMKLLMKN